MCLHFPPIITTKKFLEEQKPESLTSLEIRTGQPDIELGTIYIVNYDHLWTEQRITANGAWHAN